MNFLDARALVLRRNLYSESSVTLALFTSEYGRIDAIAKGARREKSPLFGHLDLYQIEDVTLLERPSSGMDLLVEAAFANEHAGLRFFPAGLAAAGVLAELVLEACMPRDPHPEIFHILSASLAVLAELGEPAAAAGLGESAMTREERRLLAYRALKTAFLGILRWLGLGPELSRCVGCGKRVNPGADVRVAFRGGTVCGTCRAGAGRSISLSKNALAALRAGAGRESFDEMSLSESERREWLRFLVDYSQYALEKPLSGARVLFQLLR